MRKRLNQTLNGKLVVDACFLVIRFSGSTKSRKRHVKNYKTEKLQDSLVLVHGGMAQNVGPILEMVTEKYLLRSAQEWEARIEAIEILEEIKTALLGGDIRALGEATHRNFFSPLQKIIPCCTNLFTNTLIEKCESKFGDQFWGFWMLGGMAGGGMGFIFDPSIKIESQKWLQETMQTTKRDLHVGPAGSHHQLLCGATCPWSAIKTAGPARCLVTGWNDGLRQ